MRRFCITLALVGSLLVAAAPAHASSTAGHRLQARTNVYQANAAKMHGVSRARTTKLAHRYTYGRT